MEYGNPYSMSGSVFVHSNLVNESFREEELVLLAVEGFRIESSDGEVLFESPRIEAYRSKGNPRVFNWDPSPSEMNLVEDEITIKFTLVMNVGGAIHRESAELHATRQFAQVRNGDLTGATP